jgi:hypothetical protein
MTGRVSQLALSEISEAVRDNTSVIALGTPLDSPQSPADAEYVDVVNVLMNLQAQETTYHAALTAAAKAIQPSLAAFLR